MFQEMKFEISLMAESMMKLGEHFLVYSQNRANLMNNTC